MLVEGQRTVRQGQPFAWMAAGLSGPENELKAQVAQAEAEYAEPLGDGTAAQPF